MKKYEVIVTVWSSELNQQIKQVAGVFGEYTNAKLFKEAYEKHYSANAEIIEFMV